MDRPDYLRDVRYQIARALKAEANGDRGALQEILYCIDYTAEIEQLLAKLERSKYGLYTWGLKRGGRYTATLVFVKDGKYEAEVTLYYMDQCTSFRCTKARSMDALCVSMAAAAAGCERWSRGTYAAKYQTADMPRV